MAMQNSFLLSLMEKEVGFYTFSDWLLFCDFQVFIGCCLVSPMFDWILFCLFNFDWLLSSDIFVETYFHAHGNPNYMPWIQHSVLFMFCTI